MIICLPVHVIFSVFVMYLNVTEKDLRIIFSLSSGAFCRNVTDKHQTMPLFQNITFVKLKGRVVGRTGLAARAGHWDRRAGADVW
jgi:hypothetical protein